MSAALERRYRSAVRWYPAKWRASNADAVVGTLLDVAEAENRDRPRASELRNLVANGLLARFAWIDRLYPSAVRDRAASLALGFGFSVAVITFFFYEWAPLAHTGYVDKVYGPAPEPFASGGSILSFLWIAALLAAVIRLGWLAKLLLVSTLGYSIWFAFGFEQSSVFERPNPLPIVVLALMAIVALTGRLTSRPLFIVVGAVGMGAWYMWDLREVFTWDQRLIPNQVWFPLTGDGAHFFLFVAGVIVLALVIAQRTLPAVAILVASLPILVAAWFSYMHTQDLEIALVLLVKIAAVIVVGLAVRKVLAMRRRNRVTKP